MKIIRASLFLLSFAAMASLAQEAAPPAESEAPAPPEETAPAAAAESPPEATIPVPYAVSRYESAWSKNPFLRKTVVIAGPVENFGKDWALNGMAEYDGKVRVTMINKQTGEHKHVTNQDPPDAEFRLIKANFNRNRSDASAEIAKGTETATITYDENLTAKPITINNTQRGPAAGGGVPGAVNAGGVRPGQPQQVRPGPGGTPTTVRGAGGVQAVVTPPGAVNPGVPQVPNGPQPPTATQAVNAPPTISRRRQLVPAPVIPPSQ